MVSDEGLNAYGALTWGQFFIYQGFNDKAGWMHTSSSVDNIDEYLETVTKKADGSTPIKRRREERPLVAKKIVVPYKTAHGMAQSEFTVYRTHRGPIVRRGGRQVGQRPADGGAGQGADAVLLAHQGEHPRRLQEVMELHTNSSNNTLYADADGNIAYFHSNFVPKRDPKFDWTKPVDGSDPATEWNGVLSVRREPERRQSEERLGLQLEQLSVLGRRPGNSPKQTDFPTYVDAGSENPRGVHAIKVLTGRRASRSTR